MPGTHHCDEQSAKGWYRTPCLRTIGCSPAHKPDFQKCLQAWGAAGREPVAAFALYLIIGGGITLVLSVDNSKTITNFIFHLFFPSPLLELYFMYIIRTYSTACCAVSLTGIIPSDPQ